MRFEGKTKIEKAWLVAAVGVFVLHRLLEASSSGYHPSDPLRLWLELAMIVLSFPFGGLTLFALHSAAFWCDDCRSLEFLFDWSTLLFAGYIQWFWVLPEFLRSRKLNLLDLKQSMVAAAPGDSPAIKEAAATATHEATPSFNATPAVALATTPAATPPATPAATSAATPAVLSAARPDAAAKPRAFVAVPHPAFDAAAFAPVLAEFDEEGLTALDRVFQAQAPTPAQGRSSHVEAIFPRVS